MFHHNIIFILTIIFRSLSVYVVFGSYDAIVDGLFLWVPLYMYVFCSSKWIRACMYTYKCMGQFVSLQVQIHVCTLLFVSFSVFHFSQCEWMSKCVFLKNKMCIVKTREEIALQGIYKDCRNLEHMRCLHLIWVWFCFSARLTYITKYFDNVLINITFSFTEIAREALHFISRQSSWHRTFGNIKKRRW